jgi:ketosteroid isomerase-like protein
MQPPLPDILKRYFAFENAGDAEGLAGCFTADATVLDEGRTFQGPAAIRQWMTDAKAKYHHTAEPLRLALQHGRTVVTATVAGDFPGSPVRLAHAFRLEDDRIASLEIG